MNLGLWPRLLKCHISLSTADAVPTLSSACCYFAQTVVGAAAGQCYFSIANGHVRHVWVSVLLLMIDACWVSLRCVQVTKA